MVSGRLGGLTSFVWNGCADRDTSQSIIRFRLVTTLVRHFSAHPQNFLGTRICIGKGSLFFLISPANFKKALSKIPTLPLHTIIPYTLYLLVSYDQLQKWRKEQHLQSKSLRRSPDPPPLQRYSRRARLQPRRPSQSPQIATSVAGIKMKQTK